TDPPASIEDYVQQSGRAGRDGLPAACHLILDPADRDALQTRLERGRRTIEAMRTVYQTLRAHATDRFSSATVDDLLRDVIDAGEEDVDETDLHVMLSLLERAGLIARHLDFPHTATLRVDR